MITYRIKIKGDAGEVEIYQELEKNFGSVYTTAAKENATNAAIKLYKAMGAEKEKT